MTTIPTPNLSRAAESGNADTSQLLEIAANEIASGDLRDLILGASQLVQSLKLQLTAALETMSEDRREQLKREAA